MSSHTPQQISKALLKHGADVNTPSNENKSPLHIAAERGKVASFAVLFSHGAKYANKDMNGKTCFDLLPVKHRLTVLTTLQWSIAHVEAHDFLLWFILIQEDGDSKNELFAKLKAIVETLVSSHPVLAAVKDTNGRVAVDVASKPMKVIIQSVLLWHGRYRITESRPDHMSGTCSVFKAVDEHTIDNETGQPIKIALKLMRMKDQFQREISARDKGFNNQMVMNVLQQVRPNPLHKVSLQVNGGVYRSSKVGGVYLKSSYRCVENALVETVHCLRSEDPTKKLTPRYCCSKHEHEMSLNPTENKRCCDVCSVVSPRYVCGPCDFDMCETCFIKEDDHQEIPAESTTWLLTIQEGKDAPETELVRSEGPTVRVSDAVFSNIKVEEDVDGTVIVVDVQTMATHDVGQDNEPEEVLDVEADATGQLTKANAEKLYLLVMPLADRNLFVALKQERWAGKIWRKYGMYLCSWYIASNICTREGYCMRI